VTGGLASVVMIGLLACVIVRQRRYCQPQQVTSSTSITTDVDNEKASVSDSDAESCSPVQDIAVTLCVYAELVSAAKVMCCIQCSGCCCCCCLMSCSPVQDIAVSQSTPDLIGRDAAGYLATGRAPDVIDGAFHFICQSHFHYPFMPPSHQHINYLLYK